MKCEVNSILKFIFVLSLAAVLLASGCGVVGRTFAFQPEEQPKSLVQVGFDFANQNPESAEGDIAAKNHLFLHQYPVPTDGFLTEIAYLNDSDTTSEGLDVLILRPNGEIWNVISRIHISDDVPPSTTGTTVVNVTYPISVQKDDIFAHWQEEAGGAIPVNVDNQSIEGLSVGQYGFQSEDIEVGQQITQDGYTGQRDYFINVLITKNP